MRIKLSIAGILAAAALVAVHVPAASAASGTDQTAELIVQVAPSQGQIVMATPGPIEDTFAVANATIPAQPDRPVVLHGAGDAELTIAPPATLGLAHGQLASDGTIVYNATGSSVDFAVQGLDNGAVRMQTIIRDASASHEFSYALGGGFTPIKAADGTYWAYRFTESGEFQVIGIGAAWARDANGAPVPTHYEVNGTSLVQVVDSNATTAYPVVADPTWQWYNFAYGAGFSKDETRTLASLGAVTGFCALLPSPLSVVCGVAGADWFLQAQLAANANECVFIAAVPAPIAVRWYSSDCH